MATPTESIGRLIRGARESKGPKGMTQSELARRVGTRQQTIEKIEGGKIIHSRFLAKIALELDIPLDRLLLGVAPGSGSGAGTPKLLPSSELRLGKRDLPVHVAVESGRGEIIVSTDPVDWVDRPAPLANVVGAYGIIVVGESMTPEFEPGDVALVHPHLPPIRNVSCVFLAETKGDARATIKRLVQFNEKFWTVQQWSPAKGEKSEFQLLRSQWPKCHRIVGRYCFR